jgi:Fic family protein
MASLKNTLEQIDTQIAQLQRLLPLKPEDQQRLDKKFRLEFNYNSNHIEGNTLTYGETELLILRDETKGDHEFREYEEMKGHDLALKMIQQEANDIERPLTEQFIRLLNEMLLVRPFWKEAITQDGQPTRKEIIPGQYKSTPNSVRLQNGEIFHYPSPDETKIQMPELVAWYNEHSTKEHPLLLAALLHYRFVRIHPFDDGNGRIARLLMNYVLLRHHLPMVVIKSAEKDKKAYLASLNRADIGEIDFFINYIGEQLLWSLDLNIKAAKGEEIEETNDWQKEIELIKRKVAGKNNIGKSPKLIYDIFKQCNEKLWPVIKNTTTNFDTLFNEEKLFNYINHRIVSLEMSFADIIGKNTFFGQKTIFGNDIYQENINSIVWQIKKYALKGTKRLTNYEINLAIYFEDNKYAINTLLNNKNIFSINKSYTDFILTDEINELNSKLKTSMLEQIKKDTNG